MYHKARRKYFYHALVVYFEPFLSLLSFFTFFFLNKIWISHHVLRMWYFWHIYHTLSNTSYILPIKTEPDVSTVYYKTFFFTLNKRHENYEWFPVISISTYLFFKIPKRLKIGQAKKVIDLLVFVRFYLFRAPVSRIDMKWIEWTFVALDTVKCISNVRIIFRRARIVLLRLKWNWIRLASK